MNSRGADDAALDADALVADELMSRLRVIEQQPLYERAPAFGALHESLSRALESLDTEPSRPNA